MHNCIFIALILFLSQKANNSITKYIPHVHSKLVQHGHYQMHQAEILTLAETNSSYKDEANVLVGAVLLLVYMREVILTAIHMILIITVVIPMNRNQRTLTM